MLTSVDIEKQQWCILKSRVNLLSVEIGTFV